MRKLILSIVMLAAAAVASDKVEVTTQNGSARELQAKAELESILNKYDLSKYTFTRRVVFEQKVINHAFPVLTMNPGFLGSDDEMLSTFVTRATALVASRASQRNEGCGGRAPAFLSASPGWTSRGC